MNALLQMGFYCGVSMFYPYDGVYCPKEDCLGDCRGVYMFHPKSAPLPAAKDACEAYDLDTNQKLKWAPRSIEKARQEYLGARVCYWGDRK